MLLFKFIRDGKTIQLQRTQIHKNGITCWKDPSMTVQLSYASPPRSTA